MNNGYLHRSTVVQLGANDGYEKWFGSLGVAGYESAANRETFYDRLQPS